MRECVILWGWYYGVWGVTGWTWKHFNINRLCPNVSWDTATHLSAWTWKGDRGRSSIFTVSHMTSCIHYNRIQFQSDHSMSNIYVQNHGRLIGARHTYYMPFQIRPLAFITTAFDSELTVQYQTWNYIYSPFHMYLLSASYHPVKGHDTHETESPWPLHL
jgi:hypothetical protein